MPYLSESSKWRLTTLCMLYVSQGLPQGFLTIAMVGYLTGQNWDQGAIGKMLAMCTLPWAFKFIWGPIVDRFSGFSMGRRRPWILFAQSMMGLTILSILLNPNVVEQPNFLIWMVFIHNCFASLQDVSSDALAVELLDEKERGRASGLMTGSSYLGSFIGGAGFGFIIGAWNIWVAIALQGVLLFCIMLFPLLLRERRNDTVLPFVRREKNDEPIPENGTKPEAARGVIDVLKGLYEGFSRRSALMLAGLAMTLRIGTGLLAAIIPVLLIKELKWSETEFTTISGFGLWAGLIGSVGGGIFADIVGARRLFAIAAVTMGVMWIVFGAINSFWEYKWIIIFEINLELFLMSVMTASLIVMAMGQSLKKVAASQFTFYMAMINLSTTAGAWLAEPFKNVPIVYVFYGAGIFQLTVTLFLLGIQHQASKPEDKELQDKQFTPKID